MDIVLSFLIAANPSAVAGIFTTSPGTRWLSSDASATMRSASAAITCANSLPVPPRASRSAGSTSQIGLPSFATMLGLVVTPCSGRMRARRFTAVTSAVSR
jgi:hypothetical protein